MMKELEKARNLCAGGAGFRQIMTSRFLDELILKGLPTQVPKNGNNRQGGFGGL